MAVTVEFDAGRAAKRWVESAGAEGELRCGHDGEFAAVAGEESGGADPRGVGADEQEDVVGAGEEAGEDGPVFSGDAGGLAGVAAVTADGLQRWVAACLLEDLVEGVDVGFGEEEGRAAAVLDGYGREVEDAHEGVGVGLRRAEQDAADLGAALGEGAEAAEDFGEDSVDDFEADVHFAASAGERGDVHASFDAAGWGSLGQSSIVCQGWVGVVACGTSGR